MRKILLFVALFSATAIYAQNAIAQEQTATIHVSGMTCSTCPVTVRHRVKQMKGVHDVIVDYEAASASATATITYEDSEQSPGAIAQTISKLGYPATVKDAKQ
jgi:mercuric ion binding protein